MALFHPVGRPGVGGHIMSLAEYAASFRTVHDREQRLAQGHNGSAGHDGAPASAMAGGHVPSMAEVIEDVSTLNSFHCNPHSVSLHPELTHTLINWRKPLNFTFDNGSELATPRGCMPAACRLYSLPQTGECKCKPLLLILGQSGAGLPWHWHQEVRAAASSAPSRCNNAAIPSASTAPPCRCWPTCRYGARSAGSPLDGCRQAVTTTAHRICSGCETSTPRCHPQSSSRWGPTRLRRCTSARWSQAR